MHTQKTHPKKKSRRKAAKILPKLWKLTRPILYAWLITGAGIRFLSGHLIFRPQSSGYHADQETFFANTPDNRKIALLFLPNPDARNTILYAHGNAEDLGHIRPVLEDLRRAGFQVCAFDYRGFGLSDGKPSIRNAHQDIQAAFDFLTGQCGIPANRIILFGRSVGGAFALQLATQEAVAGLILESTFTSIQKVLFNHTIFPFDRLRNSHSIRKINCPLLLIHGQADQTIAPWHSEKLYRTAKEPKTILRIPGAGHDDIPFIRPDKYYPALRRFADSLK